MCDVFPCVARDQPAASSGVRLGICASAASTSSGPAPGFVAPSDTLYIGGIGVGGKGFGDLSETSKGEFAKVVIFPASS